MRWWGNKAPAAAVGRTNPSQLTERRGWRERWQEGKEEAKTDIVLEENYKRGGSIFGREIRYCHYSFASPTFLNLLPLPAYFFFFFRRLLHNTSASGDSSNTLLWPKYSSVVWWLAKRKSRGGGCSAAHPQPHISRSTFKIQTLI